MKRGCILWICNLIDWLNSEFEYEIYREETESGDCETRDSYSDSLSEESESDKLWRWDGSSSEEGCFEQDSLWHLSDRLGHLYCQYFERSTPYGRVPLMDKVSTFSGVRPFLTLTFPPFFFLKKIIWCLF